jgi:simple sugar transport system substrate-binding protein/ribose transport system substrate-binding protein
MRRVCLALVVLVLGVAPVRAQGTLAILALDLVQEPTARAARAAEAAGLDKGWEVEVEDARGDIAAQGHRLEALAERKVGSILLVRTRVAELERPLAAVADAGIPVVSVLSGIGARTATDVTVNEYEIGARIGAYLAGAMRNRGSLLMERAASPAGARIRGRVMDLVLEEERGLRLAASRELEPAAVTPDAALGEWLDRHLPGVGAVWTAEAGQAFLTDDLLRARGVRPGTLLLTTVDGGQEAFRRLRDPTSLLTATVVLPYELMGEAGVDALEDLLAGTPKDQIATGPQLFIDTVLVDRAGVPPEGEWPW